MRAGGNGYDVRLWLAGAVRVRGKPALRQAAARKNEQATAQEQRASLIGVFHERILAWATGRKVDVCDTFASVILTKQVLRGERIPDKFNVAPKLFDRRLG